MNPSGPGWNEFSEFIRCHRQKLLCTAMRLCHNPQDAEDLVQDTFERALIHFGLVSSLPPNAQRAWLARTLTCRFIDICRQRSKEVVGLPDASLMDASMHSMPPEESYWERVSPEDLRRAVEQLPARLALPFMRRMADLSYKAIAAEFRVSENTVAGWLFQARKELRELLRLRQEEGHP
jgi:RNA polymerase sigma-70 factor (ECF subfamily)